jgi:predicted acyl esterase
MLAWASAMLAYNARPPDPRLVGERWRDMWFERMQSCPPFVEAWVEHQRRDAYWQHGSVCENYADITCAVYAVGGWADGYTNPVFRLLEGLPGPKKGLVGPWSHEYATVALPNPAIGFMPECLRWWDYWLKDIDNGIMDEPMLRVWLQDSVPPQTHYDNRPGRWVAEPAWPAPAQHIQPQKQWLNRNTLDPQVAAESALTFKGMQTHGLDAGVWCAYGLPGDMPGDQRAEDGKSLCFTGDPLAEPVEILGFPEVTLTVAVDCPIALLAVRLCDVAPDGASTLVSRGLLNLTHRDSHEHPTPLEPRRQYTVAVRLNACGHRLPAGHRWRVAVAPTYWPLVWPSPQVVTLTLFTGPDSYLTLPVRAPQPQNDQLPPFEPPERAPFMAHQILRPASRNRTIQQDLITGATQLINVADNGCKVLLDNNLTIESTETDTYSIVEGNPLSAHVRCQRTVGLRRDDWRIKIETNSTMSADAKYFHLTNQLDAYEGNVRVFTKSWTKSIPRDLV